MISKQKGLSLIELITAVTIIGITLAVAIPAMEGTLGRKNIESAGRIFEQSINFARTEAATLSQIVRIIPESGSTDWSNGWRLEYTDSTGSTKLIRKFEPLTGDIIFNSSDFTGLSPMQILPSGQALAVGTLYLYYADCETGNGLVTYSLLVSGMLKKRLSLCGGTP